MHKPRINVMWFRRDLRLVDNAGLYHALKAELPVLPLFIFDTDILDKLDNKKDARVAFIHAAVTEMQQGLLQAGSSMEVLTGKPIKIFEELLSRYDVAQVFTNSDYELYAAERDGSVSELLKKNNATLVAFKDHVIFEKDEVIKDDGRPYTVFTPYSKKWKANLRQFHLKPYLTEKYFDNLYQRAPGAIPTLREIGFENVSLEFPSRSLEHDLVKHYGQTRDIPGINGTSRLGVHFRFGTVSIRMAATIANEISPVYLNELIWRDFYQMILWFNPRLGHSKAFKPAYDNIEWRNDESDFAKWCAGNTGYPIVDAGMRELNATGFMHNRVRMIVASFLCKHLLIDWRWGEAHFAEKLLDFDFASNNGGWQWAAGSGCDAAPYFRIFNPYLQTKKFDPKLIYINRWVPEFQELTYPEPMVDHDFARKRCLEVYARALKAQ